MLTNSKTLSPGGVPLIDAFLFFFLDEAIFQLHRMEHVQSP
jgi:hypothetical protein